MRSAYVFLTGAREPEVRATLTRTVTDQGTGAPLLVLASPGDPIAYINFERPEALLSFPDDREEVEAKLGGPVSVAVSIDISGRHYGRAEVLGVVRTLLDVHHGVACDDWGGFWSADDLTSDLERGGRYFFEPPAEGRPRWPSSWAPTGRRPLN